MSTCYKSGTISTIAATEKQVQSFIRSKHCQLLGPVNLYKPSHHLHCSRHIACGTAVSNLFNSTSLFKLGTHYQQNILDFFRKSLPYLFSEPGRHCRQQGALSGNPERVPEDASSYFDSFMCRLCKVC